MTVWALITVHKHPVILYINFIVFKNNLGQQRVEAEFDSFCKTVVKNYARDLDRKHKPYWENEVLCDDMPYAAAEEIGRAHV